MRSPCMHARHRHRHPRGASGPWIVHRSRRRTTLRTLALLAALAPALALAFDLEGHRGTRGLAPENTLAAFRRALDIGVTTIETDMGVTKDYVSSSGTTRISCPTSCATARGTGSPDPGRRFIR